MGGRNISAIRKTCLIALTLSFALLILASSAHQASALIQTNKETYAPSDSVIISISGYNLSGKDVSISQGANIYRFLDIQQSIRFYPKDEGTYKININDNGRLVESKEFLVKTPSKIVLNQAQKTTTIDLNNLNNINQALNQTGQNSTDTIANNSGGMTEQENSTSQNGTNETSIVQDNSLQSTTQPIPNGEIQPGFFSRILNLDFSKIIDSMNFFKDNSQTQNQNEMNIEERSAFSTNEKPTLRFSHDRKVKDISKIKIRIEKANTGVEEKIDYTITTANGDLEVEIGNNRKIKPGQYKVIVDDGLTVQEKLFLWGLISINTKKPIYHPGEDADIYLVVLDKSGYKKSRAYIELNITDPYGNPYFFTTKDETNPIREVESGVYLLKYHISFEGNYTAYAKTEFEDVNATSQTSFYSKQYYEFDILRTAPFVIDPWLGSFKNTFRIISHVDSSAGQTFDLTEIVPVEFEITNTNAEVVVANNTKILIWRGLTNNSVVSYSAQTPLITPYIYLLGQARIDYSTGQGTSKDNAFYEARPWYLAIDPTVTMVLNETSTASYTTPPADIAMGADDITEDNIVSTIAGTSLSIFAIVNSTSFGNNGILIPSGTSINFGGTFQSNRALNTYITWFARKSSEGTTTPLCQFGNNNTGGQQLGPTNNVMVNQTAACSSGAAVRLNSTDILQMYVNIYNSRSGPTTVTHYWDGAGTASYLSFNAYSLGFLVANLSSPTTLQNLAENTTFAATCFYNCTGGSCFNANISVQANISGVWTDIASTGHNLFLDTGSNPQTYTEIYYNSSTSFTLRTNTTGMTQIRCAGVSDYSSANGTQETSINITMKNYPPEIIGAFSDQGSNKSSPTTAGTNVLFTINATDINNDLYKLLICPTNSTSSGSCTQTAICQSGFVASGTNTSCTHTTSSESGSYEWFGFVCDNQATPLCSPGDNGTGVAGSPYYINNPPMMNSINLSSYVAKINDIINVISYNATDEESDALQIICGNETGLYNLCASSFGELADERNCSFASIWADNAIHTIYCALNDSFEISAERTAAIIADNTNPITYLNTTNNSYFNSASVILNFTIIDANPLNCSLWLNLTAYSGWGVNQTYQNPASSIMQSFNPVNLLDDFYIWNVQCFDNASNNAYGYNGNYTFAVDTTGPNATLIYPENSSSIDMQDITFYYNATDLISNVSNCSLVMDNNLNQTSVIFNKKTINSTFTLLNMSNGKHNWSVSCTDVLGNQKSSLNYSFSIFVDEFPPNIDLISPQDQYWTRSDSITFTYNVSDASNLTNCTLFINQVRNHTNQTIFPNLYNYFQLDNVADSKYNWSVECVDNSSIHNTAQTTPDLEFYIDTINPDANIETEDNSWFATSEPIIFFNMTDNLADDANYTFFVNGIADLNAKGSQSTGMSVSVQLSPLPDGNHTYYLNVIDLAGNEFNTSNHTLIIDTTLPSATINTPENNTFTNNITQLINFTLKDNLAPIINYTIYVDDSSNGQVGFAANNTETTIPLAGLTEGIRKINIQAKDKVGHTNTSTPTYIIVDITKPYIVLNSPMNEYNLSVKDVMFNYTGFDNLAISLLCNLTLDNAVVQSDIFSTPGQAANITRTGLSEGYHVWNVTCVDNATNENTSNTYSFLTDTIKPNVSTISPANNTVWNESSTVLFEYNITDASIITQCDLIANTQVIDTSYNPARSTTINFTKQLSNKEYNWTINCIDVAGNSGTFGTYNLTVNYTFDDVPPEITLYFPQTGYWNNTGNINGVNYSANDMSKVKNCSLIIDGKINQTEHDLLNNEYYYFDIASLGEGVHSWNINCTDNATNNNSGSSEIRTLNIDKTLPAITQNAPVDSYNTSYNYVMLNYTANDNMATQLTCNLTLDDGNVYSAASTPGQLMNYTANALIEGYHYWNVTCTDNATNTNTSSTHKITTDYTGPIINLESPANNTHQSITYNITFYYNTTDAYTGTQNCTLIIDNVAKQTSTNITDNIQQNFSQIITPGHHNWSVNCTDTVGNKASSNKYNLSMANLLFANPITPDNHVLVDRDQANPSVNDNETMQAYLTNNNGDTLVTFKANLTMPVINGQKNIILGTANTNQSGYASINWNGTDANGQKMYAGNYTWWAEAQDHIINGTRIIYLYGGLNLTYRFETIDPNQVQGDDSTIKFDMFLKSNGPESDVEINGTYLASVNLTLTKPDNTKAYVSLVDPDIKDEVGELDELTKLESSTISKSNNTAHNEIFSPAEHILKKYAIRSSSDESTNNQPQDIIHKIGNERYKEGVIALNTEKEKYAEGETAKIKIAVLDRLGYLSDRDDFLIILKNGEDRGQISEFEKAHVKTTNRIGVYELDLNLLEGNYTIEGFLNNQFITQNHIYIFDNDSSEINLPEIIRKTQIVIDPAKEPVTTEISVKNLNAEYNLTEQLPKEFTDIKTQTPIANQIGNVEDEDGRTRTIRWNNLANNTIIKYTAKVPLLSPNLYQVGKAKIYYDGNIYQENRPWIIAIDPTITMQYNETSTGSYTDTIAQINLSAYDGTENQVSYTIPSGSPVLQVVNATSLAMGSNGIYIPNGNIITFHGTYLASGANVRLYVTWIAQKYSNGETTQICMAGNNNTLGTPVPLTRTNLTDTCNSPGVWLNGTDKLSLRINVFSSATNTRTLTHYWDDLSTTKSYETFNAYKLGFLYANLTSPLTKQELIQDETFTAICGYNCTGGSCLNANISVQANVSGVWTDIKSTGHHLYLDTGSNPQTFSEINTYSTTPQFTFRANQTGTTQIRCAGVSDFSNYNGTQNTLVNITLPNFAPVFVGNVSDQGSNKTNPTLAGMNVLFTANATDINNDLYKLVICPTNSITSGSCTATPICQSGFASNATTTSCTHGTTGESGAYTWFGFACDNQATPLCSIVNNGTNVNGTPYYVNNAPAMTAIFSDRYLVKQNDQVIINTTTATDQESDDLQLICGNETGNYNLCQGLFGPVASQKNCSFNTPWTDNNQIHTIYCALNDSYALSAEKTINVLTDNTNPTVYLNITNQTYRNIANTILNYTIIDANPKNCSLWLNLTSYSGWGVNQTDTTIISNVLQSFNAINLLDGYYTWNVQCFDNVSNSNFGQNGNYTFTIDTMQPQTNLISPDQDFKWVTGLDVNFQYSVYDTTSPIKNCSLILNNKINKTAQDVQRGSVQEFTTTLSEGLYNWSVNCTDYALNTNASEKRNLTVNISGDATSPTVVLNSPSNNYWNNFGTFTFRYTPNDNSAISACRLIIDDVINQTNNTISLGVENNFTLDSVSIGSHTWTINCTDYNSNSVKATQRIFGYDTTAPIVNLENPADLSQWTASDRVTFSYNTTDVTSAISSCSLMLNNNVYETHNTISEDTTQTFLEILNNQQYNWSVNCTDLASNTAKSSTFLVIVNSTLKHWIGNKTLSQDVEGVWNVTANASAGWFFITNNSGRQFTYDITGPNITIISPQNNTRITGTNVTFEYNLTDNYLNISNCSVIIDSQYMNTSWNLSQNINYNYTQTLAYKNHTYMIECYDAVGNKADTGIIKFNITYIDLMINGTSITFSDNKPVEGTNITIFADIHNIGNEDAQTFITRFYEGNPLLGGTQIGSDTIISQLNANSNITINQTWLARQGNYDIYVLVDTPLDTNGSIPEINEGNNENFSSTHIPIWQYTYGNITEGTLFLDQNSTDTIITWNTTSFSGNIYVTDSDNQINWLSLKALGRDSTDNIAFEDFYEADIALNTTNMTDSINHTFTLNNLIPNQTTFNVYGTNVTNVSYALSSNTTNFITGILWDSSQRSDYNGSQDLVLATRINKGKSGAYGTYDYEIRIPANLRRYQPSQDTIAFYTDIE